MNTAGGGHQPVMSYSLQRFLVIRDEQVMERLYAAGTGGGAHSTAHGETYGGKTWRGAGF
jgi:hypothetical protein